MTTQDISQLNKQLYSTSKSDVLSALDTIKHKGDTRLLPALLNLYETETNSEISHKLETLLYDIKDQQAVPILAKAVADTQNADFKTRLISVCWNTGLDFSEHLSTFTKIFTEADFLTAFEAFTLIDNTEPEQIKENEIIKNQKLLHKAKTHITKEKSALFESLEQMFSNLKK